MFLKYDIASLIEYNFFLINLFAVSLFFFFSRRIGESYPVLQRKSHRSTIFTKNLDFLEDSSSNFNREIPFILSSSVLIFIVILYVRIRQRITADNDCVSVSCIASWNLPLIQCCYN